MTLNDPFGVKKELILDSGKTVNYMSLPELEAKGVGRKLKADAVKLTLSGVK